MEPTGSLLTFHMIRLSAVEQRNEGARVGQDHDRLCSAFRNASPVRRARPPVDLTTPMTSASLRSNEAFVNSLQYRAAARLSSSESGTPSVLAIFRSRAATPGSNRTLVGIVTPPRILLYCILSYTQ